MDIPVELNSVEYSYVGGHFTEEASAVPKIPRGKTTKGRIAVLVDLQDSRSTTTASDLRQDVVAAFYADPSGSFTSTLRRVLQTVNASVYAENENAIRTDRTYASIACAVVRGDDVYIALVGQALCFGLTETTCERLGRCNPQAIDRSAARIGSGPDIGVDLFHRTTSDLSALVLTSPGIVDLDNGEFEKSLASRTQRVGSLIRELGQHHTGQRPFRSLALTLASKETAPIVATSPRSLGSSAIARAPAVSEPIRPLDARRPRRSRAESPHQRSELVADQTAILALNGHSATMPEPTESSQVISHPPDGGPEPMHDAIADARRAMRGLSKEPGHLFRSPIKVPAGLVRGASLVLFVVALFGLGYLIALVASGMVRTGVVYADAVTKLSQAEQRERDGLAATDPVIRRNLLTDATQLASASLQERPGSAAATASLDRIQKELAAASGATPLGAPTQVVALPTAGDQLVLNGNDLAVLDRATSQVYLYLLNADGTAAQPSDNPILVRRGDHVGPATIGNIASIAWLPAGGSLRTASWVMLDRSGYLIQYDPTGGLSLLALPSLENWPDVTGIRGFGGNLFVLNPKRGSIDWYQPQPTGFDGTANSYVATSEGINLTDAIDFSVQNDVYVTHASGSLDRFTDGKAATIAPLSTEFAPVAPKGLAVGGSSVFVGDPNHARIVQLDRQGEYQRALKSEDPSQLTGLRDLALSDDEKNLYVLTGSTVLRYVIPAMP